MSKPNDWYEGEQTIITLDAATKLNMAMERITKNAIEAFGFELNLPIASDIHDAHEVEE